MKRIAWKWIVIGLVMAFSGSALADNEHEYGIVKKFDLDQDGIITRDEYDLAFEQKMDYKLIWLDINKDGVISPEEFIGRHRDEFDKRWSRWDTNGDDIISVDVVLKRQLSKRKSKNTAKPEDQ